MVYAPQYPGSALAVAAAGNRNRLLLTIRRQDTAAPINDASTVSVAVIRQDDGTLQVTAAAAYVAASAGLYELLTDADLFEEGAAYVLEVSGTHVTHGEFFGRLYVFSEVPAL